MLDTDRRVEVAVLRALADTDIPAPSLRWVDLDGTRLGHFTLTDPLDAALVDDRRVAHGVTPVESIDPSAPAHRDVLVVTFAGERRSSQLSAISHPPSAQEPA